MTIKAKCRNCNKESLADQFRLDYKLRMMVCPPCFNGKTKPVIEKEAKNEPPKPLGWDKEDEYLEKAIRLRKQQQAVGQWGQIPGTPNVRYTCAKCKYSFQHDLEKRIPRSCPYCNSDVPKLR